MDLEDNQLQGLLNRSDLSGQLEDLPVTSLITEPPYFVYGSNSLRQAQDHMYLRGVEKITGALGSLSWLYVNALNEVMNKSRETILGVLSFSEIANACKKYIAEEAEKKGILPFGMRCHHTVIHCTQLLHQDQQN